MQHKLLHLKYVNMQDNSSPFFNLEHLQILQYLKGNKRIHEFKGDDGVGHF